MFLCSLVTSAVGECMLEVILLHVQHISKPDSTQDAVASLHRELLTRRGLSESSGHDQ